MTFPLLDADGWVRLLAASALKGSVVLAAAFLVSRALRRASAAARHLVWAAALASLLAITALSLLLPSWQPEVAAARAWSPVAAAGPETSAAHLPAMTVRAILAGDPGPGLARALFAVWAAGFLLSLAALLAGALRLALNAARSTPLFLSRWMRMAADLSRAAGLGTPVRLLMAPGAVMPVTWGAWRPRVLLPVGAEDWPVERMRVVLAHELAHVRRRDWLLQILAEIGRAVYWFHPLVWIGCDRLRRESECACDDAVLCSGVEVHAYAEHLLELARTLNRSLRPWSPALAMARPSNLEMRFTAMLNPSLNRRSVTGKTAFLTALAALCLIAPLAALNLPVQSPSCKFSGTVLDATGRAVPNATIIASNATAKTKDMTVTGQTGMFEFTGLATGSYKLEVLKPGFARFVEPKVELRAGESASRQIVLQLGEVSERIDVVGKAPAKAARAPSEPSALQVGGSVQQTKITHMVRPAYPPVAKAAGIEGAVLLEAVIAADGSLRSLRVMNSQIDSDLAKSAVEAVSQWRYQPTLLNCQPVDVITQITVNFTLSK